MLPVSQGRSAPRLLVAVAVLASALLVGTADVASASFARSREPASGRTFDHRDARGNDADSMHARYYSPIAGRFLTPDPINSADPANPQSWNKYAYALNNPINYVDPDGRESVGLNQDLDNRAYLRGELTRQQLRGRRNARGVVGLAALGTVYAATYAPALIAWAVEVGPAPDVGNDGPLARGGAEVDNVSESDRERIQSFANRNETEVTVVGSRAEGWP